MNKKEYMDLLEEYKLKIFLIPTEEQLLNINEAALRSSLERIKKIFEENKFHR